MRDADVWPPMDGTQRRRDDRDELIAALAAMTADRRSQQWRNDAACKGLDTELFFPQRGESSKPAKAACAGCPVREPCAEAGMSEHFGIYGGLSERQRKPERRQRRNAA